jgi:hypothetical protein
MIAYISEKALMPRTISLAIVGVVALTFAAESAPRRKRAEPRPEPRQVAQDQDEYRSCDVAVREFVQGRKEATALPVKEVKADGLRMTLNFVHPYGESGDTPPNLGFTRGESNEERRKALNEAKARVRMLMEATRTGNVWYVIALNKDNPEGAEARRSPASVQPNENRATASATVFANIENRCVTVHEYRSVPSESLSPELRTLLGEKGLEPSTADKSAAAPPS